MARNEKQDALEQWLRRVPDDPGGLLRRKFSHETKQRLRRGEYENRQGDKLW
jgi:Ca-activated chloride channel family protein